METTQLIPSCPHVQARTFRDVDELNLAAKGWQIDFGQLDRGPLACHMVQIADNGLMLSLANFDRRIDQQGTAPSGAFTFAVPRPEAPRIVWRSRIVPPGSMIVYQPDSEIAGASRPGFEVLTLSIASDHFEAACCAAGRPDLVDAAAELELVKPQPAVLGRFLAAMQLTARLAAEGSIGVPDRSPFADRLSALTRHAIEALASSRPTPAQRAHLGRTHALRRALDFIEECGDHELKVSSVCEAAGVSERTLQYAFRERFDVTPKQYVKAHQLRQARKSLLNGDPAVSKVADIANGWGFWHMGQFAKDYRLQFGELPSETLNRVAAPGSGL